MRRSLRALLAAVLAFGPAAPAAAKNAGVVAGVRSSPVVSLPGLGLFSVSPLSSSSGLVQVQAVGPAEALGLATQITRVPAPLAPAASRGVQPERQAPVPAAFQGQVARLKARESENDAAWAAYEIADGLKKPGLELNWREQLGLLRAISPYAADPAVAYYLEEPMRRLAASSPAAGIHFADALTDVYPKLEKFTRYNALQRVTTVATKDIGAREAVRSKLVSRIFGAPADAGARELAGLLPKLDEAGTEAAMVVVGAEMRGSAKARRELWPLLRRAGQNGHRLAELPSRRLSGGTAQLRKHLPELWSALRDPKKLGPLIGAMTALRHAVPYYPANTSSLAPIEWARRNGYVFEYGDLRIVPVSESFRRFIVTNERGDYAVELKIPGQEADRDWIGKHNFTLAKQLNEVLPGSVARPVYFAEFKGSLRIFGGRRRFDADDTLGVLVLEYEDSKRLSNTGKLLARAARARGAKKQGVMLEAKAKMALAAAWIHANGWAGSHPERGNDMHGENIRLTTDGRAQLVADFGAFERRVISAEDQRSETLTLLGDFISSRDPAFYDPFDLRQLTRPEIRTIYALAVNMLKDVPAAERAAIRRQLDLELGGA